MEMLLLLLLLSRFSRVRLCVTPFGSTPGVGDGQGGLVCCSPWGGKESDTTERLN